MLGNVLFVLASLVVVALVLAFPRHPERALYGVRVGGREAWW